MRFWFCAGTAGELIKLYPLMRLADDRGLEWRFVSTGQSAHNLWRQWDDFKLPRDRVVTLVETQSDLHTPLQALLWFFRALVLPLGAIKEKLGLTAGAHSPKGDFWVIHGDTLSTLLGAIYGKRLGLRTVHIEAGLRSTLLLKPFPEEINRRLVSRLVEFHFTPDHHATENLRRARVKGQVVETSGNTLMDAIARARQELIAELGTISKPYTVANIHRNENLGSPERWKTITDVLIRSAKQQPVYLVLHPPTQSKLDADPELRAKLESAGVKALPRQRFTHFLKYLHDADYVLSDGGSNQEECFYLGLPCLILRDTTERFEGLAEGPCLLSKFDATLIDQFLTEPANYRRPPFQPTRSPSQVILDTLVQS